MGEDHPPASPFPGAIREKRVPRTAGGRFDRSPRARPVRRADFTRQFELLGNGSDEPRIPCGSPTAQAMVQMANHEIPESGRNHEMKQRHRIRSTRDPDEPSCALRCLAEPLDHERSFHSGTMGEFTRPCKESRAVRVRPFGVGRAGEARSSVEIKQGASSARSACRA